jgi:hypothetical protein
METIPNMTDRDALAALVAALEGYLAAKGRGDAEWMAAFNRLLKALQGAKRELGLCPHGNALDLCTDEACWLAAMRRVSRKV